MEKQSVPKLGPDKDHSDSSPGFLRSTTYHQHLQKAHAAYRAALRNEPVQREACGRKFDLVRMFRCYHCGLYFCPRCSPGHFGPRKSHFDVRRRDLAGEVTL